MTTHPEGLTRPADDSSAQETNVGAPHGAIRARQVEDDAAAVMTTGGGVGRKFYVEMGAFAPKLAEQEVAHFLTAEELDRFQLMADSLTVVIVHGLVPNVAGNRGRDKLAKAIIKALRPTATLQGNAESPSSSDLNATGGISRHPE